MIAIALSWVLYHIGDIISNTFMRFGWGYSVYNNVMIWSSKLDKEGRIWKDVK